MELDQNIIASLITGAGGSVTIGGLFLLWVRSTLYEVKKISPIESRVALLETKQEANNKTAEEVIRMSEQIKYMTQELRHLSELVERRMNNG